MPRIGSGAARGGGAMERGGGGGSVSPAGFEAGGQVLRLWYEVRVMLGCSIWKGEGWTGGSTE